MSWDLSWYLSGPYLDEFGSQLLQTIGSPIGTSVYSTTVQEGV